MVDHSFTIRLETIDRESEPPVITVATPKVAAPPKPAPKPPPPQTPSPIVVVEARGYLKPAILAAILAAMAWYFFARRRTA